MSEAAVKKQFQLIGKTYAEIVDKPIAWAGNAGKNWIKFWEQCQIAVAIDASLRRSGFEDCIFGERGCPSILPVSCGACVDLSQPATKDSFIMEVN